MKWLPGRKSDIQILPNGTIVTQIRTKWYNCYINSDKMVHLLYGHVTIVPFWLIFSGRVGHGTALKFLGIQARRLKKSF